MVRADRKAPMSWGIVTTVARALRSAAWSVGLIGVAVDAAASSSVVQLGFQENGYSSSGPVIYDNLNVPKDIDGDATLVFNVAGNFETDGHFLEVKVDGVSVGTFFTNGGPANVCPRSATPASRRPRKCR